MTLAELVKDRPTIHPEPIPALNVLPLAATVTAMRKSTTAAASKSGAQPQQTLLQRAMASPVFKRANLPLRALEAVQNAQGDEWHQAKSHAEKICQTGGMVLLCGGRWTGKTVMAVAIALEYLKRNSTAVYSRGIGLLKDLRMDFNQNTTDSREAVRLYQRFNLLIVDEVGLRVKGEAGYSDSDAALFTDLIDERYLRKIPTLFISNENKDQTFEKLGPSVTRRIDETGEVIEATWPSFRR